MGLFERRRPLLTFTVVFLALYAPIETWYSFPALWDPFYLVDLIGMVLIAWGAISYRRHGRPGSLAVLATGYGWAAANFWRALFGRVEEVRAGGALDYGLLEMCFTLCVLLGSIAGAIWSLRLVFRATHGPTAR